MASTIIGAIVVMLVTSTLPVYAPAPCAVPTIGPVNSEGVGMITDYKGDLVEHQFKKNKNTGGFIISGDMAPDKADVIVGSPGSDKISAGKDNDVVCGGDGDDQISGGSGNDSLYGENGDDTLLGGKGLDTMIGGDGDDTISGGAGNEVLADGENVNCGRGEDIGDSTTTCAP